MIEVWALIKGYESSYKVSNLGNVYSLKTNKLLKFHYGSCGYLNVFLYNGFNKKNTKKIHRLVAIAFIDNPENKPEVNHKDTNKHNNIVSNLEWATGKENVQHAKRNGLLENRKGEDNAFSKLTEEQVKEIRNLRSSGMTLTRIAKQYSIAETTVSQIANYRSWKHI